jgi:hypothetical protein
MITDKDLDKAARQVRGRLEDMLSGLPLDDPSWMPVEVREAGRRRQRVRGAGPQVTGKSPAGKAGASDRSDLEADLIPAPGPGAEWVQTLGIWIEDLDLLAFVGVDHETA